MTLETQAWCQEAKRCWSYRTKIHQQMTQLKAGGERLYIKGGKDLMTKRWVMLIFIKRRK